MISYKFRQFGAPLVRTEEPTPTPQGSQVLLRVLAAGVCHTDLHTWAGWYDMGGGKRLSMGERGVKLPLTLGHEIAGEVVAAGADAPADLVGKRHLVYPWIGCGECKVCLRGKDQLCTTPRFLGIFRPGGYSDHVLVPHARYLVALGDMVPEHAAPYACSGLTMYSAIGKIDPGVLKDETVVVVGAGGLGLMAVTLLRALGGPAPIVIETSPARRDAAMQAGALIAFDPAQPELLAQVKAAAGGVVWAALDCVGSASTVQMSLDMLVKGGQLIQVGLFGGQIELPTPTLPLRSLGYHGSYVGSLLELKQLMQLAKSSAIPPIPTDCRALGDVAQALDDLEQGRSVGRIVLRPEVVVAAQGAGPD